MNTMTSPLGTAGFKKLVISFYLPVFAVSTCLLCNLLSTIIASQQFTSKTTLLQKKRSLRTILTLLLTLLLAPLSYSQISLNATLGTTTGSYTTMKGAFDAINAGTHKGDIVITITANTSETSAAVINASGSGSASYSSINIYPTTTGLTISGALASPLIDLNGADNIVFDGRVNQAGATDLIITNTNTGTLSSTIRFYNDACNNTIQYCTIKGATTNPTAGVIYLSTANASGTGNTGNIISNCNITKDAAGTPLYLLLSNGTVAKENVATISNNNFYDFGTMAIWGSGPNKNWIINNNSIYQTTTVTGAVGMSLIRMQGGDGFSIYNNYLGGSSANCGGSAFTVNSAGAFSFTGISVYGTTSPASSIYGNTIQNIDITAVNSSNIFCGIYAYNGNVNIGTDGANTIGSSTGNGSITVRSNVNGGAGYSIGIFVPTSTTGTKVISNNIIGSISLGNSNLTSSSGHKFWGIYTLAGTITVSNNTIGSTVTSNSINTTNAQNAGSTADNQYIRAIEVDNGPATITGNTIANLNNSWLVSTASAYGSNYGIYVSSATTSNISNNIIYNISTAQPQTSTGSVYGIYLSASPTSACNMTGNTIYNLSNTSVTGAVKVHGIYYQLNANWNLVEKNLIHSLYTVSSTAVQYGIYVAGGYTSFKNNLIRLGIDKDGNSITTTTEIYGMYLSAATNSKSSIQYNTIYIGGSGVSTATTVYTYGIYKSNTSYDTLRNNIILNMRTNISAMVRHYPVYYTNSSNIPSVSDYNVYYYTSGHGQIDRGNATLQLFRVFQVTQANDLHSTISDPKLVNPTGNTSALDLSISTLLGSTPVEGTGLIRDDIGADYNAIDRSSVGAADIGAIAGNYVAQTTADDYFTPFISYTPITSVAPQSTYTLTSFAVITDQVSGVNTTVGSKPRLYYKKNTDANTFGLNTALANGWKWVEANNSCSPYEFTIDHTILYSGSPASGTVQYFIIAQDLATTPNILCWPLSGSVATGVSSITTAPTTLNSYTILQPPLAAEETIKTITGFQCNWSASSGATGYYLDVATDNLFTSFVAGYENLNVANVLNYSVAGLSSNTVYYYRLRSYNSTGTSINSSTITANTLIAEPTISANTITFSNNLCGGIAYSFSRGNGAYCAVFAIASGVGTVSPVDGSTYTANRVYGSGSNVGGWYCIYNGTANNAFLTGLTNGTTYRLMVIEYSGLSGFENYYTPTASGNPANYAAVAGTALTGTKYIKATGGDYSTISTAVAALNGCGVGTGGVTFILGDTSYPAEVFPITMNAITGASSSNRITFQPESSVGVIISGDYANSLIRFNNTDYVTFNGLNTGGSSLTIKNLNTGIAASTILFTSGATYDIITNCSVLGAVGHTSGAYISNGVIAFTGSTNQNIDITYCNIGPAANNKPANCIKAGYATGINNNITIDHCNLYNWFADGGNDAVSYMSAAINIGYFNTAVNNTNWTISNNSFYFTNEQVYNLGRIHGIYIYHGYNYTISGNYFGGSEALCGGNTMKVSGSPYLMGFVFVDGHTTYGGINSTYSNSINNNTIQNIDFSSSNATATGDYSDGARFFAVGIHSGKFTIENNLVGSMSGSGSITLNNSTFSEYKMFEFYGPTSSATTGTQVPKIRNNNVGGISISSTYSEFSFVSAEYSNGGYICKVDSISDNTFGSSITNNISATSLTNANSYFRFIYLNTSNAGPVTVLSNNIMQQVNITAGPIYVVTSGYSYHAIGNTLRNLTTTGASCTGFSMSSNDSYSGINISRNLIYNLSAATTIYGIAATSYYSAIPINNNIIVLGNNVSANVDIRGIYTYYLSNVYFNTVVILGTGTSGTVSSYAFYRNSSWLNTVNVKNNVFYNGRSNSGGTGSHYAIYLGATSSLSINYNDYYVTGTGGMLGYSGGDKSTIALWRTATAQDVNSLNINPLFANVSGMAPGNYYTGATLDGVTGTAITTDYYAMSRASTPKIGAIENLAGIWIGTSSSDFGTASNWFDNIVPATGASIIFAALPSNHCVLDQDRSLNTITNSQSSKRLDLNGFTLTIAGSLNLSNGAQIDASATTSKLVFAGTASQSIPSGALTNNILNRIHVNNSAGVVLSNPVIVTDSLILTSGLLTTTATNLITLTETAVVSGASDVSFVNGPIKKVGNTTFMFPVGKSGTGYQAIEISAPSNLTDAFTAEYMRADASSAIGSNMSFPITLVSQCEYWQLDRTTGTSSVDVTIYGNIHSGCGVATGANYFTGGGAPLGNLRMAHWNGSAWEETPCASFDIQGTSPDISITATSVSTFSPFTFGSISLNPLPVTLTKFEVSNDGHKGYIQWYTSSEINNERFDIERSIDGVNFSMIGRVTGHGTTFESHVYQFVDPLITSLGVHIIYYRLKQIDFNGATTYSKVAQTELEVSSEVTSIDIYPNPIESTVNIGFNVLNDDVIQIRLIDWMGKEYTIQYFDVEEGKHIIQLNTDHLASGVYIIEVSGTTIDRVSNKLIKK